MTEFVVDHTPMGFSGLISKKTLWGILPDCFYGTNGSLAVYNLN